MNNQNDCQSDSCLLAQIKATDLHTRQTGWEAWYLRDKEALLSYVTSRAKAIGGMSLNEDIVHDCFEIGFRNITEGRYLDEGSSLLAYLKGIAKNLIREAIRLHHRESTELPQDDSLAESQLGLEVKLLLKEHLESIADAYQFLFPVQQQILYTRYSEGKSSKQISQGLRLTPENTRIIASRAVASIQRSILTARNLQIPKEGIWYGLEMLSQDEILEQV